MLRRWAKGYKLQSVKLQRKPSIKQLASDPIDLLTVDLNQNTTTLRTIFADCTDVVFRSFLIEGRVQAMLIYISGMSNLEEIDAQVLAKLMPVSREGFTSLKELVQMRVPVSNVKEVTTFTECIESLSSGNPVLLLDQENMALSLGLPKWEKRAVDEPTAEGAVRGPRDGFTETLAVNTSLIRRRLRTPKLKMQSIILGEYSKTQIVVAYIEGIVDKTLVKEIKNRLGRIEIDSVLESGYLEELIQDNSFTPFPLILSTERPDVVVGNLMEGRVAILVDGSPFVLIAPTTIFSLLQSSEDYYQGFLIGTAIRLLRYFFLLVSLLLPSIYVATLTFHQEMVPTSLLISIASSREIVPFPALVEALIMEVAFEALREAGIRLPKQVGAAVSIVGALVIGQAAVQAGLVSAPMVMVVAITGIAAFMIPRYTAGAAIRLLRFPIILLAGSLGLLGITLGIIVIMIHLFTLRSFGVPYLSPVAPLGRDMLKDTIIRGPWWMMDIRPHLTGEYNQYRQSPGMEPSPTKGGENG